MFFFKDAYHDVARQGSNVSHSYWIYVIIPVHRYMKKYAQEKTAKRHTITDSKRAYKASQPSFFTVVSSEKSRLSLSLIFFFFAT